MITYVQRAELVQHFASRIIPLAWVCFAANVGGTLWNLYEREWFAAVSTAAVSGIVYYATRLLQMLAIAAAIVKPLEQHLEPFMHEGGQPSGDRPPKK